MTTMRAVLLREHGTDPTVVEKEVPEPASGEVRIAMRACGICGSDLHIIDGSVAPAQLPIILGHEASGVVDAIGDTVDTVKVGDRVTVNPMTSCGQCRQCLTGRANLCPAITIMGLDLDGAHADYFIARTENVISLPDSIDFALGAIVADAIATPLRAIRLSNPQPGDTAAVFGLGGLGLHAAMLLKQVYGVHVIGVDASDTALERAGSYGIDEVIDARSGGPSNAITSLTGGGVDVAFEFVGSVSVVDQAVLSLGHGGRAVVVGVGSDRLGLSVHQATLVARGQSIIGSLGYVTSDIEQLLTWLDTGRLNVDRTISHRFGLDDYPSGLATLRDRSSSPIRVVISSDRD